MRRTRWYGVSLAAIGTGLGLWSSGVAQTEAAGNALRLTVARARELAMTQNAGIRASAQSVISATAQKNEARAARLPGVSLSARYARLSDVPDPVIMTPSLTIPTGPGTSITTPSTQVSLGPSVLNSYNLTATAQVPLFTGFRLENREKAAEYAAKAAGEDFAASQSEVGNRVEQVYWRLHSARATERVISESVRLAEAHLEDVRRLHAAGMATADDILAVQVRLAEAKLRQIQAENASELVRATLCNLLSVPVTTEIALVDSPSVALPAVPEQDALVSAAIANRP
ncbi:MAG TPA: TolC family protein, partial [Candidatus Latescibacteria bacterium]|nr:TolC family protein [Candidatus Latescibacterota bacterium]